MKLVIAGIGNCRLGYWQWKYCWRSTAVPLEGLELLLDDFMWFTRNVNKVCRMYFEVKYRDIDKAGTVYGGPMYYLSKGLEERGFAKIGKILAIIFAVLCIGASFGGGNAAQSNQAAMQLVNSFGFTGGSARTIIGIIMMIFVGIIIIGGIKRIASVTEKIVPFMALTYLLACLYI